MSLPLVVTLRCEVCGNVFSRLRGEYLKSTTRAVCSLKCFHVRRRSEHNVTLTCVGCGIRFVRYRSRVKFNAFHTEPCYRAWQSRNKDDPKEIIKRKINRARERYQTDEAYRERVKAGSRRRRAAALVRQCAV